MTDIATCVQDLREAKETTTKSNKAVALLERKAAQHIRNAAKQSLVKHATLVDVANHDGASACETGAQKHTKKRACTHTLDPSDRESDGDIKHKPKRCRNLQQSLLDILEEQSKANSDALKSAQKIDMERAEKTETAMNRMADALTSLAESISKDRHARIAADEARKTKTSALVSVVETLAQNISK
ncbi:hypothetical protein BDV93DRAFT_562952 [Ceratobasidium sp. AG-I]|nr:hypothetical protein BDV93DRAFT_562952 [Ceratobasidium sp. AG-I]